MLTTGEKHMSVKVELTFLDLAEASRFFRMLDATPAAPAPTDPIPTQASAQITQHAPMQTEHPIKVAQKSLADMMSRFPSGQGALKAREILGAHGLKKVAEASPETAAKLIAAFNAAQPAAF